ncbi:DUF748 domain-containing protein [Ferrimonas gelatinilytica]|uniref:DUF748 domain-containing protein n=1 Tax=Ferrimonas gelatinilytica TaxID=1255257 RepID=A0ABP9RWV8_9GAMM
MTPILSRRWIRNSLIVIGVFILYLLLAGLALPALLQSQAPKWVAKTLDGELRLGEVRFHPLRWVLTLEQLSLLQSGEVMAGAERAMVDLDPWRSLFAWEGRFHDVEVDGPVFHYREYNDGSSNVVRLLAPLPAADAEQGGESDEGMGAPALRFREIAIRNGELAYHVEEQVVLDFDDLSLDSRDLYLAGEDNRIQLALTGPGGGRLTLDLSASFHPLALQSQIDLKQAHLTRYWPLLASQFAFDLTDGKLDFSTELRMRAEADAPLQLALQGSQIRFTDLALNHDRQPLLALAQLSLSPVDLSLEGRTLKVGKVALGPGRADLTLNNGQLDWVGIFTPRGNDGATQVDEAVPSEPWQWRVDQISAEEFQWQLTDTTLTSPVIWHLHLSELTAGPVSQDLSQPLPLSLEAVLAEQTRFSLSGELVPETLTAQLELALRDFDLMDAKPYWQDHVPVALEQGLISTSGSLVLNQLTPLDLTYEGNFQFNELRVDDPTADDALFQWQQLLAEPLRLTTEPMALSIERILISEPFARVIINEDGTTNLGSAATGPQDSLQANASPQGEEGTIPAISEAPEVEAAQGLPLALEIGVIEIEQGTAFFADNTLIPKFATDIEQLSGEVQGLSSAPEAIARVDIRGQVDQYAPVSLRGELQPLAAAPYLDLALNFDNVELTSLNPYSGTYAGYFIDQGQMDLALKYRLEGTQLEGNNKVVLDQLKLGQRSDSEQATSLPVSLAVALLKDSNGVIDLELGISGDLEDPDFSIGALVFQALGNVITKIVTSPFTLLGNLLGTDPPDNKVTFAAGSVEIAPEQKQNMAQISQALAQRPGLTVSILGGVGPSDEAALRHQALEQWLGGELGAVDNLGDPQRALLARRYDEQFGEGKSERLMAQIADPQTQLATLYQALLGQVTVPQDALATLAVNRAAAVKEALTQEFGLSAERVFLRESRVELARGGAQATLELGAD